MRVVDKISGFCPYVNAEHTIAVTYADMNSKTTSGWKPIQFECEYEQQCPDTSSCPIVANLPAVAQF